MGEAHSVTIGDDSSLERFKVIPNGKSRIVQETERFVMVWKRAKLFAVLATIVVWSGCRAKPTAHTVKPPEFTPALKALLDENDQRYDADEQMLEIVFSSPGYHTNIVQPLS